MERHEYTFRMPDKDTLAELDEIIKSPSNDPEKLQQQVKCLAQSLVYTIYCCRDLVAFAQNLTSRVTFDK